MKFLFPSLCLLVAVGAIFAVARYSLPRSKPNILVVSACSLRPDRIGIYNPKFQRSKLIDQWSRGSYVFTNAIAEEPWQNFTFEASEFIDRRYLNRNGYGGFGIRDSGFHFFVPPTERVGADEEWFWSEDAILHYQASLADLRKHVLEERDRPFYIFTHLKYMHYPYYDPVNMNESDFSRLSEKSRSLLKQYRTDPLKFDLQLPVVSILLNNFEILKKKFGVSGDQNVLSTSGVISDSVRTARWAKAPSFPDDLELIRELYDLKMEKFDALAADVLNLFGDKRLQDNTIVIFTGDHGEALMEHGVLGHSVNVYEEMLRYPLMVKFPGHKGGSIEQQVNHATMAQLTDGLLTGEVHAENFAEKVKELNRDHLLARNCQDNIRTVRFKSEWKYIKNLVSGKGELYNLKQDPGETVNLIAREPDMAWKLEEYMIDHQADFKRLTRREKLSGVCL